MKDLIITPLQRREIMKFWKAGTFKIYQIIIPDKHKIIEKWLRSGAITKTGQLEYKINREVFLRYLDGKDRIKLF